MQTVTVQLKDDRALKLLRDLEEFNVIKVMGRVLDRHSRKQELLALKPRRKAKTESFLSLAGIWEGRNITAAQLREKAWPARQ